MARENISELVKKYEQNLASGKNPYFDADEFEDLVEYYDSRDDLDTARDIVEAGLKIHPQSDALLAKKGKLYLYDGEYMEAIKLLSPFLSEYNTDVYLILIEAYLHLGLTAEAEKFSREIIDNEEKGEIGNTLSELGFIYLDVDRPKEAISYYEKSLEYNPENQEVLSDLAYAYEMEGKLDSAIEITNRLLDVDPYGYDAWVNLGKLYSLRNQYEKAIDAFDFALTIEDSDLNVLKLKAHCLSLSGRQQEAIETYRELLEIDSENGAVLLMLSESLLEIELFDEAIECISTYEESFGETTESITKKAYIAVKMENYDKAISIASKILEEEEPTVELMSIIGEAYFKKGMYSEAETQFLKIHSEESDNLFAIDYLSIVSIIEEDYTQALMYTQKLLKLDPENVSIKQRIILLSFELDEGIDFENMLSAFEKEELLNLFQMIYNKDGDTMSREELIEALREARACRILFKNMGN